MKNKTDKTCERPYGKNEFCKALCCSWLHPINENCAEEGGECAFTAKEFHHWLMKNNFRIIKNEENPNKKTET